MTTGRINQVTADNDQRRITWSEPPHTMAVILCGSLLPTIGAECVLAWVSHLSVSRTTPASVPDHSELISSQLYGVPPIVGFAAPARLLNFFNYSERSFADDRPTCGSKLLRSATGAIGSQPGLTPVKELRVERNNHRFIRPKQL